jgi:DNA-directed RNA polymerase I subunit RPA1
MYLLLYGRHGPFAPLSTKGLSFVTADMFFLDTVPAVPTRFRPTAKMSDKLFEHPQNELLEKILRTAYRLRDHKIDLRAILQKTPDFDDAVRKKIMGSCWTRCCSCRSTSTALWTAARTPHRCG